MGKIVRSAQLATTLKNVQRMFLTEFESLTAVAGWRDITTVVPSTTKTEEMAWFGKTPRMKDVSTDVVEFGGASPYDYALTSTTRQAGMKFEREWWEDDKLGFAQPLIAAMAEEANRYRGAEILSLFTSGGLAFDGTAFFDGSRTQGESGTIDNQITVSGLASATSVTTTEVHDIISSGQQQMAAFKDDKGNVQGRMGDTLVVPMSLFSDFWQGLNTANQAGSVPAVPPIAPGQVLQVGPYKLMVNHISGAASKVYLLRTTGATKPFLLVERQKPMVDGITSVQSSEWLIDREIPYVATDRFATGYGDPRDAIEITLST